MTTTKPTRATRKPASELCEEDFAAFPIWVYVMDESAYDETYVKPVKRKSIPDGDTYHVAAEIRPASGGVFAGYLEVHTFYEDPTYQFPTTFIHGELIDLVPPTVAFQTYDAAVSEFGKYMADESRLYQKSIETLFGQPWRSAFPIAWRLKVPLQRDNRIASGVIEAEE